MAPSTLQQAPHERSIRPEQIEAMERAIAAVQAQGQAITAEGIYRLVGGRRGTVQAYVRAWRQQQAAAADVAPCPVAPASPPPVSHLVHLWAQVAQLDEDWHTMERAQHQLQQQRAQTHADLRNGILDASRLARRLRQAEAQARSPVSMMQPDAAQQRAQLRADLTALVVEAEVTQVLADVQYTPWWVEG